MLHRQAIMVKVVNKALTQTKVCFDTNTKLHIIPFRVCFLVARSE